jgi:hypothetical protein
MVGWPHLKATCECCKYNMDKIPSTCMLLQSDISLFKDIIFVGFSSWLTYLHYLLKIENVSIKYDRIHNLEKQKEARHDGPCLQSQHSGGSG